MSIGVSLNELMDHADWQRSEWRDWLPERGDIVLRISIGPHGDGRFQCVGDLVKHIFVAEKHHVERLSNMPLTDVASIPDSSVELLFQFGARSRKGLRQFVEACPNVDWDVPRKFHIFEDRFATVTPRKFVVHILLHEIRHWAQIATLLRLNGLTGADRDFLFGPGLSGSPPLPIT